MKRSNLFTVNLSSRRYRRPTPRGGCSIPRQIARLVGPAICCTGFVFPLWDARRQTLADKIMTTVWLPIS